MKAYALLLICAVSVAAPPLPTRHEVVIEQFKYKPVVLRVKVGDTIVWHNRDIVPHTADGRQWSSGDIPANARATTVATRAGEQEFTCLYHSNMKGKLIVKI